MDESNQLYVLDSQRSVERSVVRVFAPDGSIVRVIDPAEQGFHLGTGSLGMAVNRAGTVYLWDPAQQAVFVFPVSAEPYSFTVLGEAYGLPARIEAMEPGAIVVYAVEPTDSMMIETPRVYDRRGNFLRDLGTLPIRSSITLETKTFASTVILPLDLADRELVTVAPGSGILRASSRPYSLTLFNGTDTVWTLTRSVPDVQITEGDVRNAMALAPSGISRGDIRGLLPSSKSPIVELLASDDWVFVRRPRATHYTDYLHYDLIRRESGAACVTVELTTRLLAVEGSYLAGISYTRPERPTVEVVRLAEVPG